MPDLHASELRRIIDQRCDAFEQTWADGDRPAIAHYLQAVPEEGRADLLIELLTLELELRARAGETPSIDVYMGQHAEYEQRIEQAFDEFRAWAAGTGMIAGELKSRLVQSDEDTRAQALETKAPEATDSSAPSRETLDDDIPIKIGRYEVLRKLGQGGMGTVLLAHDPALDRKIAVKLPHFDTREDAQAIERFYREARSMATVDHPNLCPIHDVGEYDGRPYLTMAYIDGGSLAEKIDAAGPMKAPDAVQLVRKLALAMQTAHEAGVLHRDLKPANVMIDQKGEPFITDFGLASRDRQAEADLTQSGTVIGSPAYMAPEQVTGSREAIGPHTDVYALGVILYQLLCGRRPFQGSGLAVLGQITSGKPPIPPSELANIDRELDAVCRQAMSHDVAARFPTAAQLADALESQQTNSTSPRPRSTRIMIATTISLIGVVVIALAMNSLLTHDSNQEFEANSSSRVHRTTDTEFPPGSAADILTSDGYKWTAPERVEFPDGEPRMFPYLSSDNSQLFMTGWNIHTDSLDILVSNRSPNRDSWGLPNALPAPINGQDDDRTPTFSNDGGMMIFASDRAGGQGKLDLWVARRSSPDDSFGEPMNLGPGVNSANIDTSATLSGDGLTLFFCSDRPGGHGQADLWICTKSAAGELFGRPKNLGPAINNSAGQVSPAMSWDSTVLLYRDSETGIRICTRRSSNEPFGSPFDLSPSVNDPTDRSPHLSADCSVLYFTSRRGDPAGNPHIWMSRRVRKSKSAEIPDSRKLRLLPSRPVPTKRSPGQFYDGGQEFEADSSFAVAAGDLDRDGDVDVIVTRADTNQVWLNDGAGHFSLHQELDAAGFGDVALGDLDSDGDLDAAFVRQNSDAPGGIWLNDGQATFTNPGWALAGNSPWEVELADLDNDTDLDAVVVDRRGPNLVFRNDGSGRLVNTDQALGKADSVDVGIGDLDGDGDDDLFVANYSRQPNTVWFNDGDGVFSDSGERLGSSSSNALAISDLDLDGDLDAYSANVDGMDSIWINDGSGRFSEVKPSDRRQTSSAVAVGDLNGDTRDDLFIVNGFRRPAEPGEILLSAGKELAFDVRLSPSANATDVALADFDDDGHVDAFVTTFHDTPNRVWFNRAIDEAIDIP